MLLPVTLAVGAVRYWLVGLTGAAHPASALVRCVGATGVLVAYRWIVEETVAATNTLTHGILGFPAVGDGLQRIIGVLFGGALLSGAGGVFGAFLVIVGVVFAAGLFAAQVLLTVLLAVLIVAGPPLIAISAIPELSHLARDWAYALLGVALVPLGWTVLFATAGALCLDATSFTGAGGGLPGHVAAAFAGLITFVIAGPPAADGARRNAPPLRRHSMPAGAVGRAASALSGARGSGPRTRDCAPSGLEGVAVARAQRQASGRSARRATPGGAARSRPARPGDGDRERACLASATGAGAADGARSRGVELAGAARAIRGERAADARERCSPRAPSGRAAAPARPRRRPARRDCARATASAPRARPRPSAEAGSACSSAGICVGSARSARADAVRLRSVSEAPGLPEPRAARRRRGRQPSSEPRRARPQARRPHPAPRRCTRDAGQQEPAGSELEPSRRS